MRDRTPRSVILILDENLSGHSILDPLLAAEVPAKMQTEVMKRGLPDEELLARLAGKKNYYLLSKDSDFHRRPAVKSALVRHRVGAFIITAHKGKTGPELAELIVRAWPRIRRIAEEETSPFVGKILADGHVEVVA